MYYVRVLGSIVDTVHSDKNEDLRSCIGGIAVSISGAATSHYRILVPPAPFVRGIILVAIIAVNIYWEFIITTAKCIRYSIAKFHQC